MNIYDMNGNLLTPEQADPAHGVLTPTQRIRPDAVPVDNVAKFAYAADDYEPILLYTPRERPAPQPQTDEGLQAMEDAYRRGVQSE